MLDSVIIKMNMNNLASEAQKKLFFALVEENGYNQDQLKERAKVKFKLKSFGDITSEQISSLIDAIQNKDKEKSVKKYKYNFGVFIRASKFGPTKNIFETINKNFQDFTGDNATLDATINIGTIKMTTEKEMTPEEIQKVIEKLTETTAQTMKIDSFEIRRI